MPRISALALMFLVVLASFVSTLEARKLLDTKNTKVGSLDGSLFLSALPKGKVPSSTPSKKGHAVVNINRQLIARRLITNDRILQSVPSPGVGH